MKPIIFLLGASVLLTFPDASAQEPVADLEEAIATVPQPLRTVDLELPPQSGPREAALGVMVEAPGFLSFDVLNAGLSNGSIEVSDARGNVVFSEDLVPRGRGETPRLVTGMMAIGNYNVSARAVGPPSGRAILRVTCAWPLPVVKDIDADKDGVPEERRVDRNFDGVADTVLVNPDDDTNADGTPNWDGGNTDTDRDGAYDHQWADEDGDGMVDDGEIREINEADNPGRPMPAC